MEDEGKKGREERCRGGRMKGRRVEGKGGGKRMEGRSLSGDQGRC